MIETPLDIRVENGIRWLTEHDPHGAYHLWYTAKIMPGAPMPAQPIEVQEEYKVYVKARDQFERIYRVWAAEEDRKV
jgi:hypothetical protein